MNIKQLTILFLASFIMFTSCDSKKRAAKAKEAKQKEARVYLGKFYTELKDALNEAEVITLNDSIKVIFKGGLLFKTGSSELMPEVFSPLRRFSDVFNKYSKTNMIVSGHTDNTGSEELNNSLSLKRANAVTQNLVGNSVNASRMIALGLGSKSPLVSNDSPENMALNRRVEFVILYNYGAK